MFGCNLPFPSVVSRQNLNYRNYIWEPVDKVHDNIYKYLISPERAMDCETAVFTRAKYMYYYVITSNQDYNLL